jgi:hypothetical protein
MLEQSQIPFILGKTGRTLLLTELDKWRKDAMRRFALAWEFVHV